MNVQVIVVLVIVGLTLLTAAWVAVERFLHRRRRGAMKFASGGAWGAGGYSGFHLGGHGDSGGDSGGGSSCGGGGGCGGGGS